MSDFVIADTHFFHANIIKYATRPYRSVDEMNWDIKKRWNNAVSKKDRIFILGDFSFGAFEQTASLVANLNGTKILILGNHDDGRSLAWWMRAGLNHVSAYPIVYKQWYILSHEPVYVNEYMPYCNIHGHLHGRKMEGPQYINVAVEHTGYAPTPMANIVKQSS
jgi:calcineurin-like phosphoesterase family protein